MSDCEWIFYKLVAFWDVIGLSVAAGLWAWLAVSEFRIRLRQRRAMKGLKLK